MCKDPEAEEDTEFFKFMKETSFGNYYNNNF